VAGRGRGRQGAETERDRRAPHPSPPRPGARGRCAPDAARGDHAERAGDRAVREARLPHDPRARGAHAHGVRRRTGQICPSPRRAA
jgi:hypothetical protein